MNDVRTNLTDISEEFKHLYENANIPEKKVQLTTLQQKTMVPNFWQTDSAKDVMQEISSLEDEITSLEEMKAKIGDLAELMALISEDDPQSNELETELAQLKKRFDQMKLTTYLSGRYDRGNAILSIHSGQGGTEAMDWAAMLMRMYMRYFERKDWDFELIEQSDGEEAGVKSVTFMIKAAYAYGYLRHESGTHRLVRLSPFNADNLRQTSFAGVEVLPAINQSDSKIEIKDEDLEWQFYRAGGKGGQNVNKVNTAVRLLHKPSSISVSSQSQRNQEQNRKIALQILEAKLWHIQEEKLAATQQQLKGEHTVAGWGNQIRSYVLHPYQLVKDNRTGTETSNTQGVLDGDLDEFIQSEIATL